MNDEAVPTRIRALLLRMAAERGPEKTFCPSETARELAADWRPLMPQIRQVAAELVRAGRLRCTRGGVEVHAESGGGPIRLSLPRGPNRQGTV